VPDYRDEPHLSAAMHGLRRSITAAVPAPAAAAVRDRADHRLRVRRTAAAVAAAALVVAVAVGGTTWLRHTAAPPVQPAETSGPAPSATAEPGPRPAPLPEEPVDERIDDPIAEVDWRTATITLSPRAGCPAGAVSFTAVSDIHPNALGPADSYPAVALSAVRTRYGDLTGDGRAEAVLEARCIPAAADMASEASAHLLVVARDDSGGLTDLGRIATLGAPVVSYWIESGRLLVEANPWVPDRDAVNVPGLVLAYEWTGGGFGDWVTAGDYPPLLGLDDHGAPGAPVRPGVVARATGCPDVELRFHETAADTPDGPVARTMAAAGDASYAIPPGFSQQYLFDLGSGGGRWLVVPIGCESEGGGPAGTVLAVLERAGEGWQGVSVLQPPGDHQPGSWTGAAGQMVVRWHNAAGGHQDIRYLWTGTVLEPVPEDEEGG